jgi:DNA-binding MarR family transcriptional regulator
MSAAPDDRCIASIETALYALARRLKQARLHDHFTRVAGVDIDQAGLAVLYALQGAKAGLRVTEVAGRLGIDAPAVTRKAQQLERLQLVSRAPDADDARASRLLLTAEGRRVLKRFLVARHRWLTAMLSDWPESDRDEFARLIGRFTSDIRRHLDELNI